MKSLTCFLWSTLIFSNLLLAQRPGALIDITRYVFEVEVNDRNDSIVCRASIQLVLLERSSNLRLDLISLRPNGKGMRISSVAENGRALNFVHSNDLIDIRFSSPVERGEKKIISIQYNGIPDDGLIIAQNKYRQKTFFTDHWPNRARHWLPCVDHPSDKAAVEFMVTAPAHYQVISNGVLVEQTNLDGNRKLTHYREDNPLSMKVAAIGVADFAVRLEGEVDGVPVQSWVYPQERVKGFYDYSLAAEMLPYFTRKLGPYPYKKLANVQSKTVFGGMENAGAIFYSENSIKGNRTIERLIAHEIAHQWFGNMATEAEWAHVWLSEGFVTYISILYMEEKYGIDTAKNMRLVDRMKAIAFSKQTSMPIVDSSTENYLDLLNANSYQKGGWVLHMLRRQIGDSLFWKSIRSYYAEYAGKNAVTDDFRKIVETISGRDLKKFFGQWLFSSDFPKLKIGWKYNAQTRTVTISVDQQQPTIFEFPIEFKIAGTESNEVMIKQLEIKDRKSEITIPVAFQPVQVLPDPGVNLFYEGKTEKL